MKLIINADDFGYSRGHNYGILDSFTEGILTSATLMNTMPGANHAYQLAKSYPDLDVGIHFVATHGKALSDPETVPTLVDSAGNFHSNDYFYANTISQEELESEWRLQLAKQLINGVIPSHADSHHHIHMSPQFFPVYAKIVNEHQLAIRFYEEMVDSREVANYRQLVKGLACPDGFSPNFYQEEVSEAFFDQFLTTEDLTIEVMTHPAYLDEAIYHGSSYNLTRMREVEVLTSPKLINKLKEHGVSVISFKDL